tara:strand:- start:24040 stop:24549 length:510 start_codon:yes stop_codon:yes gene_type:complete
MKLFKAAFLDRDGVLNYDTGYVYKIKDFKWKKNVFEAIKFLNTNKYLVIIISNQSGIGRGYYSEKSLKNLNLWIQKQLKKKKAFVNKFYHAPYYKYSKLKKYRNGYLDRKPNTGMITKAFKKWKIIKKKSFIIGDKESDKKLAKNLNMKFVKVNKKSDLLKIVKNICIN